MDNTAIVLAIISGVVSLVLGIYNAWAQRQKSKEEKPVQDANVTSILAQASETVAKQYGELLDRVNREFKERLAELQAEFEEFKKKSEADNKAKDITIANLQLENERLKARVAELETELKSWREVKPENRPSTGPFKTNTGSLKNG